MKRVGATGDRSRMTYDFNKPWEVGDPLFCSCGRPECQEAWRLLGQGMVGYLVELLCVRGDSPQLSHEQQHAITQRRIAERDA